MAPPKDTVSHNEAHAFFDKFLLAKSCDETLQSFQDLCKCLDLQPESVGQLCFYNNLKTRLNYWKAKALWAKLDKKASHSTYDQAQNCGKTRCLVVGAGPCGLRTAIELAFLGAKVMVVEQRKSFSRNNVLHLWPFTILDLRALGAKKFYGRFCTGTLDHISIRQLQLILLKTTLLLGVEVFVGIKFKDVTPPAAETKNQGRSWTALLQPSIPHLTNFQFDVLISSGGSKFIPEGFRRKELRGKLAIGITANFVNRHTAEEVKVAEISGVARIYNQTFFKNLLKQTGIDLENIVYYKDDTHYFVMTAKKQSLLKMGVILKDLPDIVNLLSPENVNSEALFKYARDAASFSTGYQLPQMEFALNHHQQPDVDMFDFTCMYRAENAAIVRERRGARLLIGLVGDCLVEPFWPLGTGVARGFLAAYDAAWMVRKWASGTPPLDVLAERESIYQRLSQTTPDNTNKNISQYSIDPTSRYPNINLRAIKPKQVQHLIDTGHTERDHSKNNTKAKRATFSRKDSISVSEELLRWCKKQTAGYRGVAVTDLSHSWRSGLALCALIHHFRPHLINFDYLGQNAAVENNQLAFDVAEQELGILPILTGEEMASISENDKLSLVTYLSQFYEVFKDEPLIPSLPSGEVKKATLSKSAILFLGKLQRTLSLKRSAKGSEGLPSETKRMKSGSCESPEDFSPGWSGESTGGPVAQPLSECSKGTTDGSNQPAPLVSSGTLDTKLPSGGLSMHPSDPELVSGQQKDNSSSTVPPEPLPFPANRGQTLKGRTLKGQTLSGSSETCYFCFQKVYILERVSAEGLFFHRGCFRCHQCDTTLRLGNYIFNEDDGYFYCSSHEEDTFHPIQPQPSTYVADKTASGPGGESFSLFVDSEKGIPSANKSSPAVQPTESREHAPAPLVPSDDVFESHPTLPKSPFIVSPFVLPQPPGWSYMSKATSPFPLDANVWTSSGAQENDGKEVKDPKRGHSELMRLAKQHSRPWSAPPDTLFSPFEGDVKKSKITKRRVMLSEGEKKELARLSLDLSLQVQPDMRESERGRLMKEMNEMGSCESDEESTEEEDNGKENTGAVRPRLKKVMTTAKAETLKVRSLQRRAKEDEMKRFCKAQSIQRRLEEIEEQYRVLEQMGIDLEESLREGHDDEEKAELMDDWLHLLQDKNALVSEESDLMIAAQELELEEQQSLLELQLRNYMDLDDKVKTPKDRTEEAQTLSRMLEVVDKRNTLITYLDQKRLTEISDQFSTMC